MTLCSATYLRRFGWFAPLVICTVNCSLVTASVAETDISLSNIELSLDQAPGTVDLDEVSRQLDNPLTRLWSLTLEDSFYLYRGDAIEGTVSGISDDGGLVLKVGNEERTLHSGEVHIGNQ